jgi:hypothetical protein
MRSLTSYLPTRRGLLILAGLLASVYAVVVLIYVPFISDLGLRTAFSVSLNSPPRSFQGQPIPQPGDKVVKLGDEEIKNWIELLNAPWRLRERLEHTENPDWAWRVTEGDEESILIKAHFRRDLADGPLFITGWCKLDHLPLEEVAPTILWFILKMMPATRRRGGPFLFAVRRHPGRVHGRLSLGAHRDPAGSAVGLHGQRGHAAGR